MHITLYLLAFIAFELGLGIAAGKFLKRGQLGIES